MIIVFYGELYSVYAHFFPPQNLSGMLRSCFFGNTAGYKKFVCGMANISMGIKTLNYNSG
jgi:hypothetical protein